MNNFEIMTKIGEGAYSTVYTVKRISDNQWYALKKVKLKNLSIKEKENALNEVRILASVNSPYVISYKEAFIDEADKTLCIVMEYADEGDWYQKITWFNKRKITFDESEIWKIFVQITKGLHDLHSYNILHRDMKSANVFLFKDGTAKWGDLNVSKVAHRGLGCTQTGTPYYASPEVWKDNPYDCKSDIWSLGCVSYEMIMWKTPFRAANMEGLYKKIMKGEYAPISNKYSEDLSYVISSLLIVSSKARPNTEEILKMPEVKAKIEQYEIFKNTNTRLLNKSYALNNVKTTINISKDNNLDMSSINVNNYSEISNNINNANYNWFKSNFLNQNENENMRIVLETIRLPKKLIYLNKHLPTSNYETDKNEDIKRNIQVFSFPNQALPNINVRYNQNPGNNKPNKVEQIARSVDVNKTKPKFLNTIRLKLIGKNSCWSSMDKGKWDVIVEDDKEHIRKRTFNSVTRWKDLKYIYKPYVPEILKQQKALKSNWSEQSIFGNWNYSTNMCKLTNQNNNRIPKYRGGGKNKLIPIWKIKSGSTENS